MSDILLKVEDVANAVGVAASTVRKYSFLFEKNGYEFARNNNQKALMYDQDEVDMFRQLLQLSKKKDMTLEKAAIQILSSMPDVVVSSDIESTDVATMRDVAAIFTTISDMSTNLYTLVDQNKEHEKRRLEDHDKLLMQSIRSEQQTKQLEHQIEELKKEIAAAREEKKKSWWKFWS